ncbi:unnamed protein product, partial [Didymodactylos carnosus]
AWIITGGNDAGIMKLIGDIIQLKPDSSFNSKPVRLIGIATWGSVRDFDLLDVQGKIVRCSKQRNDKKDEVGLEPNHTHFVFVDDKTVRKYGGEIMFRVKLEQAITSATAMYRTESYIDQMTSSTQQQQKSNYAPVVLLVVE